MRALVTGGAGFIGSALVDALVAGDIPTATVDALTYAGSLSNLANAMIAPHHAFVEADVRDQQAVAAVFDDHAPDVVFHLAAETHVDRSIDSPIDALRANIEGTYAMLSAATGYWSRLDASAQKSFRFVQVSTDEVFGAAAPGALFTESSRYGPNSPYAASKASADYLVRTWSMAFDLPTVIAHGSNTYGPRQFPEKLVPLMILNGLDDRPMPIYGSGAQERDWLHVDDHVRGLLAVARRGRPGESYLLSARSVLANNDLVAELCAALDRVRVDHAPHARLIEHVADRPGHDFRYASDPSKAENELAWRAEVDFQHGLTGTVDWYLANGDWCEQVKTGYRRERLGLGQVAR